MKKLTELMIEPFIERKNDPYRTLLSIKKPPFLTRDNIEKIVSKRKGTRVKKELRTLTTLMIDNLFEKFYHTQVLKDELHILYINIQGVFDIFSIS